MDAFRNALESYCQYTADNCCAKCAFCVPCKLINKDKTPEEMGDRDIDLLFYAAIHFYDEMGRVLDSVSKEK